MAYEWLSNPEKRAEYDVSLKLLHSFLYEFWFNQLKIGLSFISYKRSWVPKKVLFKSMTYSRFTRDENEEYSDSEEEEFAK